MTRTDPALPSFKPVLTIVGVAYVLLASSWLAQGPRVMRDFGVADSLIAEPVFRDFFTFFYQLMAAVGVLMVLFAQVVRDRRGQVLVAYVLSALNVLLALRDLSTSDSPFGDHLYKGQATLMFVFMDMVLAITFASVAATAYFRPRAPEVA